jgi:hypothetical protein
MPVTKINERIECDIRRFPVVENVKISTGKMIDNVLNLWYYWCACVTTRKITEEAPFP